MKNNKFINEKDVIINKIFCKYCKGLLQSVDEDEILLGAHHECFTAMNDEHTLKYIYDFLDSLNLPYYHYKQELQELDLYEQGLACLPQTIGKLVNL